MQNLEFQKFLKFGTLEIGEFQIWNFQCWRFLKFETSIWCWGFPKFRIFEIFNILKFYSFWESKYPKFKISKILKIEDFRSCRFPKFWIAKNGIFQNLERICRKVRKISRFVVTNKRTCNQQRRVFFLFSKNWILIHVSATCNLARN